MSAIIQKIGYSILYPILLAALLFLSSCSTKETVPVVVPEKRIEYTIPQRQPLTLSTVQFKVIEIDGKLYVVLDMDNYSKLSKNMEALQGRLNSDNQIIKNLESFHNKR